MKVRELYELLRCYDPNSDLVLEHDELGIVPMGCATLQEGQVVLRADVNLCPAHLGEAVTRCELRAGHKGEHQVDGGKLAWPNADSPDPTKWYCYEDPPGPVNTDNPMLREIAAATPSAKDKP